MLCLCVLLTYSPMSRYQQQILASFHSSSVQTLPIFKTSTLWIILMCWNVSNETQTLGYLDVFGLDSVCDCQPVLHSPWYSWYNTQLFLVHLKWCSTNERQGNPGQCVQSCQECREQDATTNGMSSVLSHMYLNLDFSSVPSRPHAAVESYDDNQQVQSSHSSKKVRHVGKMTM